MSDTPAKALRCGMRSLPLDRPRVMGIVNVTPDSFSDGGRHATPDAAFAHARRLVAEGADVVDIGGESTRPGAAPVALQQELDRVLPVLERVVAELDTVVSVDTSRPQLMREAAAKGAGMINDVRALALPGALEAAAASGLPICLMHMRGEPGTMQQAPRYGDVVAEVADFLERRRAACIAAGVAADRVLVDPGFGFGKTLAHNIALLGALGRFAAISPLVVGLSRKRMIAALTGEPPGAPPEGRVAGSVAAALLAAQRGATLLRVHDVAPTVAALAVLRGVGSSTKE